MPPDQDLGSDTFLELGPQVLVREEEVGITGPGLRGLFRKIRKMFGFNGILGLIVLMVGRKNTQMIPFLDITKFLNSKKFTHLLPTGWIIIPTGLCTDYQILNYSMLKLLMKSTVGLPQKPMHRLTRSGIEPGLMHIKRMALYYQILQV